MDAPDSALIPTLYARQDKPLFEDNLLYAPILPPLDLEYICIVNGCTTDDGSILKFSTKDNTVPLPIVFFDLVMAHYNHPHQHIQY